MGGRVPTCCVRFRSSGASSPGSPLGGALLAATLLLAACPGDPKESGDTAAIVDADGDGYAAAEDCDDGDADVHPGADEVCGDGVDNDCDGTPSGCAWEGEVSLAESWGAFSGITSEEWAGRVVQAVGDLDGDGLEDVVIGARHHLDGERAVGAAYVVGGVPSGVVSLADADHRYTGTGDGDQAGDAVGAGCDVDGDGYGDLLVGAPGADRAGLDAGAAYLVRGPLSGDASLDDAWATMEVAESGIALGDSVACAGDLTGDGRDDAVVAAPTASSGEGAGGVVFLFGGELSSGTWGAEDAAGRIEGARDRDHLGRWVVPAGDLDGDGVEDLLVTAYMADTGARDAGAVYLFLGPITGVLEATDAHGTWEGVDEEDWAGTRAAVAGDIDEDGTPDILVGGDGHDGAGENAGKAWLHLGLCSGTCSLEDSEASVQGTAAGDYAGLTVAGAGDLDNDGADDFAVGAFRDDAAGTNTGMLAVFYGPVSGARTLYDADLRLVGEAEGDQAGFSASAAGDRTGDGLDDLFVGAPASDEGERDAGMVYLFSGAGY